VFAPVVFVIARQPANVSGSSAAKSKPPSGTTPKEFVQSEKATVPQKSKSRVSSAVAAMAMSSAAAARRRGIVVCGAAA